MTAVTHANGGDEWATPPALFQRVNRVWLLTVDACATAENAKLPRYWTPEQDGLAQSWAGERVWLNPPYSRGQLVRWLAKACEETRDPESGCLVVALLPVATSTVWWREYVAARAAVITYLPKRVRFVGASGSPRFDSAVVVYGHLAG